jgi:uncharacterized protein (TIGR03435 family)
MIQLVGAASLVALMSSAVFGQSAPAPLAFEVASIKTLEGPMGGNYMGFSSSGPRVTLEAYPLRGLIMEAYNLKGYQVSFGASVPDPDLTLYDIAARAEGNGARSRSEFRQMLQTLLAERFHLKAHRQMMVRPVYALLIAKNGPKFKESAPDAIPNFLGGVNGRNQNITVSKATMQILVDAIPGSFHLDRPVVDRTGLTGTYDFKIDATPESRIDGNSDPNEISIFTAVKEQLGLKLEPQKAMVEILVIDRVEKPSAN